MIVKQPDYEAERQALRKLAAEVCALHAHNKRSLTSRDAERISEILFQTHDDMAETLDELDEANTELQVNEFARDFIAEDAQKHERMVEELAIMLDEARPYVARVAAPHLVHPVENEYDAQQVLRELDTMLREVER